MAEACEVSPFELREDFELAELNRAEEWWQLEGLDDPRCKAAWDIVLVEDDKLHRRDVAAKVSDDAAPPPAIPLSTRKPRGPFSNIAASAPAGEKQRGELSAR